MESKLIIDNKKVLSITSVIKVKTATENNIEIILEDDKISITGNMLHITRLDLNSKVAEIEGEINGVKFGKSGKENIFKKVFK